MLPVEVVHRLRGNHVVGASVRVGGMGECGEWEMLPLQLLLKATRAPLRTLTWRHSGVIHGVSCHAGLRIPQDTYKAEPIARRQEQGSLTSRVACR